MPKVSILVPVYGVEKYIEKCLISLLNQTYKNIEIIFINDCTKDRSIDIVNKYISQENINSSNVKIITHSKNRGLAAARNTGLLNSEGDFIFHLDSDDFLEENAIELLIKKMGKSNADIVFSNLRFVYNNGQSMISGLKKNADKDEYLKQVLMRRTGLNICGNLFKRALFNDIKFVEGINFGEDYATLPKLIFISSKIDFIDTPIYNYLKINEKSYTSSITTNSLDDIINAFESIKLFFNVNADDKWNKIVDESFYNLKAQMVKTTKGDIDLLKYFASVIKEYPKRYPISLDLQNLIMLLSFDISKNLCSNLIKIK